ncbi:hypothetical protein N7475_007555 [Penicillium sp. IBT 31633x]|nr:hypothetical protein N7475_007555 [Penicillium sp. IBT 31633x]
MVKTTLPIAASLLMLATTVFGACESGYSYTTCDDRIVHYFDPSNGEVCDSLDCGGGRAPVKYDVPCCAAYRGTEPCVKTTSTLSCWTPSSVAASTTIASASAAETTSSTAATTSMADTSVPSSTGVAAETSSNSVSGSTTAPSTTEAPVPSASTATSEAGTTNVNGSALPVSTNLAVSYVGSLMAVAGAAIGAVILV